jgi:hypothetical protein
MRMLPIRARERSPAPLFHAPLWIGAVALSFALGPAPLAADDAPWQLLRDADGIRTYKRIQDDSPLLEFRAEGVLDAPLEKVLSVLLDDERAQEWIPRLAESRIEHWLREPVEYIQYSHFDAPWPVRDRVFRSRVTIEVDRALSRVEIRYFGAGGDLDVPGTIEGSAEGSSYLLEPIDEGRQTWLMGVSVADPRGAVPTWVVNWAGSTWAHTTLMLLREQLQREDLVVTPVVEALAVSDLPPRPAAAISAPPPPR